MKLEDEVCKTTDYLGYVSAIDELGNMFKDINPTEIKAHDTEESLLEWTNAWQIKAGRLLDDLILVLTVYMDEIKHPKTNGDMIKMLFPKAETWVETETNVMRFALADNDTLECFNLDWWNSPYKESEVD